MADEELIACTACTADQWTGALNTLFSDDFEAYGGDEALFYANWIGAGTALSDLHANTGTWSVGNQVGAYYGRGITKDPDKAIVFAMQIYWTGETPPALVGAISFTQFAAWNFFDQQCSLQILEGGDIHFFGAPGVGQTSGAALQLNRWNCLTGVIHVANEGFWKIYCNGALILSGEGDTAGGYYSGVDEEVVRGVTIGLTSNLWYDDVWIAEVDPDFDNLEFVCATAPPINPCKCTPGGPPALPPTIPHNPPALPPSIVAQLVCTGGGLVPTQADLVYSEAWWGL
jgi:hypothetical protein